MTSLRPHSRLRSWSCLCLRIHQVWDQVSSWVIWPGIHQSDAPMEECSSEEEQEEGGVLTTHPFIRGTVEVCGLGGVRAWDSGVQCSVCLVKSMVSMSGVLPVGGLWRLISLSGLGIFLAGYLYMALFGCHRDSVNYLIFFNKFSFHQNELGWVLLFIPRVLTGAPTLERKGNSKYKCHLEDTC